MVVDVDQSPVRVLVVDDNLVVRRGLASVLEASGRVVVTGEATDGHEALAVAEQQLPDVTLLDVRMPGYGGFYALPRLVALSHVLMVTYSDDPAVIGQAIRGGATGYLIHGEFDAAALVDAVMATATGRPRLSVAAVSALVDTVRATEDAPPQTTHGLTQREVEIMELVIRGRDNAQIARALYISAKTVKNHLNHINTKLGTRNRAEATALWLGIATPAAHGLA